MTESTSIVTTRNKELTPSVWGMLKEIAPVMHVSRLFGVSSPEQATAIMLKGYELGLETRRILSDWLYYTVYYRTP